MKRTTKSLLGALATCSLLLAGCSGGGDSPQTTEPASTDTEATISFAYWDENQKPAIDKHIEEFNKEYPKIKVETTITPWSQYWTKLRTQAEGNNLPDVFWMNGPNIQLYASNDQLAPIDDIIDSGNVDLKNYPQSLVDLYTVNDHHYGIPKDYDTIAVFYNKELFDKAGVEYPTDDWTWEEFQEKAKAISDALKDEGVYGVATELDGGQGGWYNTVLQADGYIIQDGKSGYAEPGSIEGLQFWADLIADGSSPNLQQLADTKSNIMFESGKAAMTWSGTWIVSEFASKLPDTSVVDIAPLPQGKKKASVIHGLTTVISANSANLDAAKAFITYLASKEAHVTEAEMGTANPAFVGTQEAFEKSQPQWNMHVFADAAENYSYPYPVSKNTSAWNDFETDLLPQAFSGSAPVSDIAQQLAEKMQAALDEEE